MLHDAETPEVLKELIIRGNKEVTVIEMLPKVGKDIGPSTRWVVLKKLDIYGVKVMAKTKLLEIQSDGVLCLVNDNEEVTITADSVVLAMGALPVNSLAAELEKVMPGKVSLLGDANQPANAARAIEAGFKVGVEL